MVELRCCSPRCHCRTSSSPARHPTRLCPSPSSPRRPSCPVPPTPQLPEDFQAHGRQDGAKHVVHGGHHPPLLAAAVAGGRGRQRQGAVMMRGSRRLCCAGAAESGDSPLLVVPLKPPAPLRLPVFCTPESLPCCHVAGHLSSPLFPPRSLLPPLASRSLSRSSLPFFPSARRIGRHHPCWYLPHACSQ